MSNQPSENAFFQKIATVVGGAALLTAMFTDAISVVGRYTGIPFLGAIELVEASVVVSAIFGIVLASMAGSHALVHVLLDRLNPERKSILVRIASTICALVFAVFAAGSGWIGLDMIGAYEESEVIHIPFLPLRVLITLACAGLAAMYGYWAIKGGVSK